MFAETYFLKIRIIIFEKLKSQTRDLTIIISKEYKRPPNGDPPDCNDAFDDTRMASLFDYMSHTENDANAEQNQLRFFIADEAVDHCDQQREIVCMDGQTGCSLELG